MNLTNSISEEWEPMIKKFLKIKDSWYLAYTKSNYSVILDSGWIDKNINGSWSNFGHYWYFENHEDQTAFVLTWS